MGGTLATDATETALTDPLPRTLELRLHADYWERDMGQPDFAPTAELIEGLRPFGGHQQPKGWLSIVQRELGAHSVQRLES